MSKSIETISEPIINCKKVAVAILGFNSVDYLKKFIPSVLATKYQDFTLVYIDNDSKDDSVEVVRSQFPEVEIVVNDKNHGFAGGYNVGLRNVNAEYFVLLNQDVEVDSGWLEPIINRMEDNPEIAACQPKILHYHDKARFDHAGAAGGYLDALGYPFCQGRIFDKIEEDLGQYDEERWLFWASGACLTVRSELYNNLGGLDEDFFAHMEEIDFCWRLQGAGYKIGYVPSSVVYHVGGSSLKYGSYQKIYLNYRNNLLMLLKNLHGSKLIPILYFRMILDGVSAFKELLSFNFVVLRAIFMAHMSFYGAFFKTLKKRKQITKRKDLDTIYKGSIVFRFFISGVRKFDELNWKAPSAPKS